MNIDDLKDTWNKESFEITPDISTEKKKKIYESANGKNA